MEKFYVKSESPVSLPIISEMEYFRKKYICCLSFQESLSEPNLNNMEPALNGYTTRGTIPISLWRFCFFQMLCQDAFVHFLARAEDLACV